MSLESFGRTIVRTAGAAVLAVSCAHAPSAPQAQPQDKHAPRFASPAELCTKAIEAINGLVAQGLVRVASAAGLPKVARPGGDDPREIECDYAQEALRDSQAAQHAAGVACNDPGSDSSTADTEALVKAATRLKYLEGSVANTCPSPL